MPVGTLAIGKRGATNARVLAVRIAATKRLDLLAVSLCVFLWRSGREAT